MQSLFIKYPVNLLSSMCYSVIQTASLSRDFIISNTSVSVFLQEKNATQCHFENEIMCNLLKNKSHSYKSFFDCSNTQQVLVRSGTGWQIQVTLKLCELINVFSCTVLTEKKSTSKNMSVESRCVKHVAFTHFTLYYRLKEAVATLTPILVI